MRVISGATALAATALLVGACFSPDFGEGGFTCQQGKCPEGYECVSGVCRKPGASVDQGTDTVTPDQGQPKQDAAGDGPPKTDLEPTPDQGQPDDLAPADDQFPALDHSGPDVVPPPDLAPVNDLGPVPDAAPVDLAPTPDVTPPVDQTLPADLPVVLPDLVPPPDTAVPPDTVPPPDTAPPPDAGPPPPICTVVEKVSSTADLQAPQPFDMVMNPDGTPYVVFLESGAVMVASRTSATAKWNFDKAATDADEVAATVGTEAGAPVLHVVYRDKVSGMLYHTARDKSGNWSSAIKVGSYASIPANYFDVAASGDKVFVAITEPKSTVSPMMEIGHIDPATMAGKYKWVPLGTKGSGERQQVRVGASPAGDWGAFAFTKQDNGAITFQLWNMGKGSYHAVQHGVSKPAFAALEVTGPQGFHGAYVAQGLTEELYYISWEGVYPGNWTETSLRKDSTLGLSSADILVYKGTPFVSYGWAPGGKPQITLAYEKSSSLWIQQPLVTPTSAGQYTRIGLDSTSSDTMVHLTFDAGSTLFHAICPLN